MDYNVLEEEDISEAVLRMQLHRAAETGGIFIGGQQAVPIITALSELNHPQPANGNRISTDNFTANIFLTANLRQKLSKVFNTRYWWIKDRIKQRQFDLVWEPGKGNRADYFTKTFPPKPHLIQRHIFLQQANLIRLRGCVAP